MSKLFLYNTLTRKKEEFKSIEEGKVRFYYCGPTVYWTQHIGNLRGAFCVDIAVRSLKYLGYDVNFVRNYTDVGHLTSDEDGGEDKMEKGAKREGLSPNEIAEKYIEVYERDTKDLNYLEPSHKTRATKYIPEMIELVEILLEKGFAYSTDLAIYFDVSKAKDYTKLSGQKLEENICGAGAGEISDSNKKNASDFVVWFFKAGVHKNALQYWPSPFSSPLVENGEGFPGWHLECSAMSKKHLGNTLDIHMGGIEHVPVHHTNEIAQSEAANGVKFVNYWLHNGHLLVNDRKMAKSEGTGYSLEEIKNRGFEPMDLRYFYTTSHYRSKINFTWEALEGARNGLRHLKNQIRNLGTEKGGINTGYKIKFTEAICDDFNISQAMAVVAELLKSDLSKEDKLATVLDFDNVLGLKLDDVGAGDELPSGIKNLLEKRRTARIEKNWEESDRLRDEITKLGYIVEDSGDEMNVFKK